MATVVRMPSVMAGAKEAAVQTWLVAVGDRVSAGQVIAEIETEKAVFEHEAEASGVVAGLLVGEGEAAAVGAPIAVLAGDGEDADAALATVRGQLDAAPSVAAEPAPASGTAPDAAVSTRIFASPLVRRLARERGLDLGTFRGSGPGGRIVRRDVEGLGAPAAVVDGWTDVPHTPMRRAIARRLTESVSTVPHFTLTADCRVDALLALRHAINADRPAAVSLNDLVVKAVAAALMAVPDANVIWTPDATRRFASADIGVAIAIDGGLVTPVIRGVERMPLGELSTALRDVATRARSGGLRQHELEGGSFSVSNLGMYGVREFSAIINPPHAGVLAVGAATRRVVAGDHDEVGVATLMSVTLSADHRVLDGALAAQWLAAFVGFVENPVRMLV